LILQPPAKPLIEDITPKELVFVLDTSGSMSGFPIEKAKETMNLALGDLNPEDTFNLITFAGDTEILLPEPLPATAENLRRAKEFLSSRRGSGGTEMMKAITAALAPTASQKHIRVVCFMTDGYVGNEAEILGEISRHSNARVFSFGIGNSVNRYLLDKMSELGRGEVEYVTLNSDGSAAARRFKERIRNPLLTDISIEWNGIQVEDIYPQRLPDLFDAKPLVITGRYQAPAQGSIRLRGRLAGHPITREIQLQLPESAPNHQVLATLWARAKVDHLMHSHEPNSRDQITRIGMDYRLMTPYTSFVAVEEMMVTEGGTPRRVEVPVEIPDGVSYEGIFGGEAEIARTKFAPAAMTFTGGFVGRRAVHAVVGDDARTEPIRRTKLDPALTGPEASKLAVEGKLRVRVLLRDSSAATIQVLRKAGLEIILQPKTARIIIGRIMIEKLKALSELETVLYVAPAQ
jgi:Ca-activated chloride channel family protein